MHNEKKLAFVLLALCLTPIEAVCQTAPSKAQQSAAVIDPKLPLMTPERQIYLSKSPVVISFKTGVHKRANLIGPDPSNPNAVLVDLEGARLSVNLDEVTLQQLPEKFDEYGDVRFNDEKARLDNFAVALRNFATPRGYILAYGSCLGEGRNRAERAKGYMVNTRGFHPTEIITLIGGCREELHVELWVAPSAASPPTLSTAGTMTCRSCHQRTSGKPTAKAKSSAQRKRR